MDKFSSDREKKVNVEQVHKEIKAMRQLSHPNIIRLYGYDLNSMYNDEGKTRPCIVLVQEMASHGELFEYLMHTGKFEEPLLVTVSKNSWLVLELVTVRVWLIEI